jgi:heat shock protein HspQ
MEKEAHFNIGDIVIHKKQGYRAIVVDVDPIFQSSGRYNPGAIKKFKNRNPWYRLLVDESNQMTYVEECSLSLFDKTYAIDNPKINQFLEEKAQGYKTLQSQH